MSHQPERTEKNCLNCGTQVAGRYCQVCGQENVVTKQSIWGLTKHFVYDIFHFDGKFFDTLKTLALRPGRVPREYIAGKRMSYLDPIRMYLFTSAVFFLVFFSLSGVNGGIVNISDEARTMTKLERLQYASRLHQQIRSGHADSSAVAQLNYLLDTTYRIQLYTQEVRDNLKKHARSISLEDTSFQIRLDQQPYIMGVDKIRQEKVEVITGSSWLNKRLEGKWKAYKQKFADDDQAMIKDMINSFLHKFPYILFVSLPFFALILKLLYIRRKQFYYSDHAVFTLYHYIFTFLLLLLHFLLMALYGWLGWQLIRLLAVLTFLSGGVYLLFSMRRFYQQKWWKTLGKFLLLNVLALTVVCFLMVLFIILQAFQL